MHIAAEAIGLAHDEVHEHHVGEIPDLYELLNSSLIKFTARVFAVQLERVWVGYFGELRRSCKSSGSRKVAQMRIGLFAAGIELESAIELLSILSVNFRIAMSLVEVS